MERAQPTMHQSQVWNSCRHVSSFPWWYYLLTPMWDVGEGGGGAVFLLSRFPQKQLGVRTVVYLEISNLDSTVVDIEFDGLSLST